MITVVIPAYNSAEYIDRAIQSVISQTYKDWEIVIVDDASTDNTWNVLMKYNGDNRIKVVKNEVNKGVGVSRKVGINNASGEYITFLDSDDYLLPNYLEVSLLLAKQHDSDVVYTSFGILFPNGLYKDIKAGDYIMEGEATVHLHFWAEMNFLTGKLFKTELVKNCKWSERRIGEDVQTLFYATYEADKVRSSNYVGYIHVFRENSLLAHNPHKLTEEESLEHNFKCFIYNSLADVDMLEFLEEKKDTKIKDYMRTKAVNNITPVFNAVKSGMIKDSIVDKYRKDWNFILNYFKFN